MQSKASKAKSKIIIQPDGSFLDAGRIHRFLTRYLQLPEAEQEKIRVLINNWRDRQGE